MIGSLLRLFGIRRHRRYTGQASPRLKIHILPHRLKRNAVLPFRYRFPLKQPSPGRGTGGHGRGNKREANR